MEQYQGSDHCQEQAKGEKNKPLTDLDVVFEGTHDAISIVNVGEDGAFYYHATNQRYRDITGKKEDILAGKTPEQVYGPITGKHITQHLKECLQFKKTVQYQETLELAGSRRSALVQLSPIIEEGQVKQILSSTRDITEQKEIEYHLEEQKKNLQVLFTNSSEGIAFFDSNHLVKDINQRFTDIFGYTLDEIAGKNLDDVISIPDVRKQAGELTDKLMTGTPVLTEAVRFHKDGHSIYLGVRGIAVEVDGKITGGYGIYTDITRDKMAQEALRISEERWQFALEGSGNGVWDWDMETDEVFFSGQYQAILGYDKGELPGYFSNFHELVHPEDWPSLIEAHDRHIEGDLNIVASEYRMKCRNGQWKWVLSKGKIMRWDATGKALRMVGTITDITERKQSEEKIRYLSYHDKLTGLYNRAFFEEEMYRLDCQRNWPLAIMICDVDGLKMANDFYGHHVGDQLLQRIAKVLSNACRKDDIIARWGGDEFAILLPSTTEEDALEVGERINRFCEEQQDLPVQPSISWGAAAKDTEAQTVESLIRKAELGMYKQKVKSSYSTHHQLRKRYDLPVLESPIKREEQR